MNHKWKGTIAVGAIGVSPSTLSLPLPASIISLKRPCWIASHDFMNINGCKTQSKYAEIYEEIKAGTVITMTLTHSGCLCNLNLLLFYI